MSLIAGGTVVFDCLNVAAQARVSILVPPIRHGWFVNGISVKGPMTDTQPVNEPVLSKTGVLGGGINSFLYGRVYLTPSTFALGNLVSAQTRTFKVWNATFGTNTLATIGTSGVDGMTLTPPFAIPHTFAPLEESTFTLNVDTVGPVTVDGHYIFTFGTEVINFSVTGTRVVLWPFGPNWARGIDDSLEWNTSVLTSFDGSEQRIRMRSKPRRRLEYDFTVTKTDTQRFDNILWGWQNRMFAVPQWMYGSALTAQAVAGTTSLSLSTTDRGFIAGEIAVLYASPSSYEVVEVATVSSGTLALTRATINTWPVGTKVYPATISKFEGDVPVQRQTSSVLTGHASFLANPAVTDPYVITAAATDTYNGKEIILKQPDWAGGVDNSSQYPVDAVDYSIGRLDMSITRDTPVLMKRYRWLLKSRAEVRSFRSFLGRLQGMLNSVYIPSWHDDLTMSQSISAGATTIFFYDRDFYTLVGNDPARAHLMIRTRNNGNFVRPISSVGRTGNEVSFGITTALGVALTPADILAVHYVGLYRLAADRVSITWMTDSIATAEATFQLVKA